MFKRSTGIVRIPQGKETQGVTDLYETTGVSPGPYELATLASGSARRDKAEAVLTSSNAQNQKIEWTINNHYYIHSTPPLFENKIVRDDRLLTKKEIANFLNISIKMIDRKVAMKEIPFLKIGKLVRFNKETVLRWAKESIEKR